MANARSKVNASLQQLLAKKSSPSVALRTLDRFEQELPTTKDHRAMVLVTTAIVEQLLEDAILVHCTKVFDKELRGSLFGGDAQGAAISGFYGKIILGRALAVYGKILQEDLDRMRRIRNVFAHAAKPLTFKSPGLSDACTFNILSSHDRKSGNGPPNRFLEAAGLCSVILYCAAKWNRRLRPKSQRTRSLVYAESVPVPTAPKTPSRRPRKSADQNLK